MKSKSFNLFLLFLSLIIIVISSFIFDTKAQHAGYYQGWWGLAPDGKWTCKCPVIFAPDCLCHFEK